MENCRYGTKKVTQDMFDLCQYIIQYEHSQKRIVTNLRLQKLLYFIQAHCFINMIDPSLPDKMQAWRYGPVMPEAYDKYRFFGSIGIVPRFDVDTEKLVVDPTLKGLVNDVLEQCSDFSTQDLIDISHHQKPWSEAYALGEKSPITQEAIKAFFLCNQGLE